LLDINKRGMEADGEAWFDNHSNEDQKVSNNTDVMHSAGGCKRESSHEKAIDDFMRSPRASA